MLPTLQDAQILYGQMVSMIGVLFGVLFTGVLLTLGVSSILLLSSGGDTSSSGQSRFLCVYLIILSSTVLAFDAATFVLGNGVAIFFSHSPIEIQEFYGTCGKAVGSTTLVIGLMADGLLVRLPRYLPYRITNKS